MRNVLTSEVFVFKFEPWDSNSDLDHNEERAEEADMRAIRVDTKMVDGEEIW